MQNKIRIIQKCYVDLWSIGIMAGKSPVILVDADLNTASLRMYNEAENDTRPLHLRVFLKSLIVRWCSN